MVWVTLGWVGIIVTSSEGVARGLCVELVLLVEKEGGFRGSKCLGLGRLLEEATKRWEGQNF